MKTIKVSIIFFVSLFVLSFLGCSSNDSDIDDIKTEKIASGNNKPVIAEYLKTPVTTIDPAYVQNAGEIMIAKLVFQGLVKENSQGEAASCIARDWEVTPDGLNYTFHLNKRILFHNGKEIRASDFKFSWERVLRLNAPAAYLFANIEGADQVLSGKETLASGITAVNDYTLKVKLVHPQKNFINLLTHPAGAVLDRYEVVEQGVGFARPGSMSRPALIPSGSGPYMLAEWIDGRNITLGRNPAYFGEKPTSWRLEFSFRGKTEDAVVDFLAGRTQILQDVTVPDLENIPVAKDDLPMVEKPVLQFKYVGMNAKIKPFDNKAVRDAVMYSLNGDEILKAARGSSGAPITGYITDYWYNQSVQEKAYYAYNKEMAVNMLAQAGYSAERKLPEIILYAGSSDEDQIAAKKIVENLGAVGIKVKVQYLSQKDMRRVVKNGEAPFYLWNFTARSIELEDFFREQIDSRWQKTISNPYWDQLLDKAGGQDKTMRLNLYRQLEKEILGDSRIRYLYTYKSAAAVSGRISNFQLGPGNNVLFEEVSLKQ